MMVDDADADEDNRGDGSSFFEFCEYSHNEESKTCVVK
jgi:hypothetical protein